MREVSAAPQPESTCPCHHDLSRADGFHRQLQHPAAERRPCKGYTALLTKLADQLLGQGLRQEDLDSEAYWRAWQRSFEAMGGTLASFMKKVKFTLNTHFFKLEIDGGAG
jgi:hypothetical protein